MCAGDPCPQPEQANEKNLEPCTPHQGFDYFSGSEVSFITAFTCLGLVPFGDCTASLVCLICMTVVKHVHVYGHVRVHLCYIIFVYIRVVWNG